jgi:ElaB/YqjD/DUF883 family membrane-anchored ribosome-binding protein
MSSDITPPEGTAAEAEPAKPDEPAEPAEPGALREEIAQTREELAETVEALAAKADVKARAQDKVVELKESAQEKVAHVTETARSKTEPVAEQLLARSAQARDKAASLLTPQTRQAATDAVRAASQRPWLLLGPPAAVLVVLGLRRRRQTRHARAVAPWV